MTMINNFYVYILKYRDNSYYVGQTNDPIRRLSEHNIGLSYTCYTFSKRPVEMVFTYKCDNQATAFILERRLKKWTKRKKEALIAGNYKLLCALAKKTFDK